MSSHKGDERILKLGFYFYLSLAALTFRETASCTIVTTSVTILLNPFDLGFDGHCSPPFTFSKVAVFYFYNSLTLSW